MKSNFHVKPSILFYNSSEYILFQRKKWLELKFQIFIEEILKRKEIFGRNLIVTGIQILST